MLKTAEDIRQLNERISHAGQFIDRLRDEIGHVIVGQSHMLDRLLIGLLRRTTGNLKHPQLVNAQSIEREEWVLCIGIFGSGVKSDGAF